MASRRCREWAGFGEEDDMRKGREKSERKLGVDWSVTKSYIRKDMDFQV